MAGMSTFLWGPYLRLDSRTSPFNSPLPMTHKAFKGVKPVSWRRHNIAGLLVTIYGLEELPNNVEQCGVACCWLLHGRGDTQDSMAYTGAAFLHAWNSRRTSNQKALICVAFDQRNHGSRMIENRNNESWKGGNPTHGPDMFASYSGTAQDLSHLLPLLPSYLPFIPSMHLCCGVSLGGHATWQIMIRDPNVTAAIIVIGCPDYIRMMTDRAIRSKLSTCTDTDPPGRNFVGSKDFPPTLLESIDRLDPAGVFLGELDVVTGDDHRHPPSDHEKTRLRPILKQRLGGKKIINLTGGKDRLVPPEQGEPFLTWLKNGIDPKTGWCNDLGISVEDIQDSNSRHEFSAMMRKEAERWLCDVLAGDSGTVKSKL